MALITCKVLKDFRSPKKNGSSVLYKDFKSGSIVKGDLIANNTPNGGVQMFRTEDGFMIPKGNLNPIGGGKSNVSGDENIEYAEVIEEKPKLAILPKDIKANMGSFIQNKSKVAVNGAVIGLVVGFAYAVSQDKSKLIFSVVGSIGGFLLGNVYSSYVNEDKK
jgi:hypothetical protein